MGNMFLGFPVPRAKIAEMITGSAAPLFPYADILYHTNFDSLDGFAQVADGAATITLSFDYVELSIGTEAADVATLVKAPAYPYLFSTWNKRRKMQTGLFADLQAGVTGLIYIGVGDPDGNMFVGFRISDGSLQAVSIDVGGIEAYTIADWTTPGLQAALLKFDYDPPAYPKFYLDDVLVYTATTRKPTGTDSANIWLYWLMSHAGGGSAMLTYLSEYMFYQSHE